MQYPTDTLRKRLPLPAPCEHSLRTLTLVRTLLAHYADADLCPLSHSGFLAWPVYNFIYCIKGSLLYPLGQVDSGYLDGNCHLTRLASTRPSSYYTQFFSRFYIVFITGRGGAGFHSPDPALTRGWRGYVSGNPRPAPVRGPPALISWTGPRLLPLIFNGDPSGVWVGRGPERE